MWTIWFFRLWNRFWARWWLAFERKNWKQIKSYKKGLLRARSWNSFWNRGKNKKDDQDFFETEVKINKAEIEATKDKNIKGIRECNWTRTHNHLVRKRALNHLAKLAKFLDTQSVPWYSGNYRV